MRRNSDIDICKGIGIISIVIGHASWNITIFNIGIPIGQFVYLYHLAIFFFCSGYLYKNDDKGIENFVIRKLKSLYVPFIVYSLLYLVFRNFFIEMGILEGNKFSFADIIISATDILTFNCAGEFLAAFWFLPVLFISMTIYGFVSMQSSKYGKYSVIIRFMLCAAIGAVGIYTTQNHFGLLYNAQLAYLMVFIVELGYLYKMYEKYFTKFIGCLSLLVSGFTLSIVIYSDIGMIELSKFMIINEFVFYPITIIGIIFCLSLAKLLDKCKFLKKLMAYIGKNSFDIMAFHFLGFKLIDYVVCHIINNNNNLNQFPHTFSEIWLLYYVVGIVFPILLKYLFLIGKQKICKFIQKQLQDNRCNS